MLCHFVFTREWDDGVDLHGLDWLSISGNDCQVVSFNGHLSRAHRREGIDHSEPVSSAGRDREYFQRRISHKASVRISKLTLSIDKHWLGILSSIHCQTTGVSLSSILVEPITDQHHVRCQIIVVQVTVGVLGRRLADNDAAVQAVKFLETGVRVPKVSAGVTLPLIPV